MAKSCIFKIIMGGAKSVGKTTFLNGSYFPYNEDEFNIGVSFKLIDCLINNEDTYLLQIWDFKVLEEFQNLYPSFCKGAKGAILAFDVTNYKSFEELSYWIEVVREIAGEIPIVLIGTKIDLENHEVFEKDINRMIKKHHINSVFFTSINQNNQEIIFKHLITKMDHFSYIHDFRIFLPELDQDFEFFMNFFSVCPLCGKDLHRNYLRKFYISKNFESKILKKRLLDLMHKSNKFEEIYYHNVEIGIPCCKCFETLNFSQ